MKQNQFKTKRKFVRVDGRLRELVTVYDKTGKLLHKIMNPVMLEFYPRDIIQVIVGASLLAVPVAFTEETWNLGMTLPLFNVLMILLLSIVFISAFVYYNYYRNKIKNNEKQFLKRVVSTYLFSFFVVTLVLFLIQRAPWATEPVIALKRTILVSFPASMSATVADIIK